MLSPGEHWKRIPKGVKANVRWRRKLYARMRESERFRRGIIAICERDFFFYVNAFVWQFNPRQDDGREVGPFILWEFQRDAALVMLDSVETARDLVIEKSREMGASWLCLLVLEWLWHFQRWQKFLCISRSADAVEDDDPDSLFWKVDFVHRYQPTCLLPKIKRRKMFFGNEDRHGALTGQASTGRAGVGGRAKAMLVDEFSQIKEDTEVQDRTSDTTGCRIFNGTHIGTGTAFFRLTVGGMRKLQMHWTQHPEKRRGLYRFDEEANKVVFLDEDYEFPPEYKFVVDGTPRGGLHPGIRSPWYDEQCGRKSSSRAIAMDLDIDPQGSVSQFFNALSIRKLQATYGCDPVWVGELEFDLETATPLSLKANPLGHLKLWVKPDAEGRMQRGRYAVGADVAQGSGATPSCLSVVNWRGEKVGEYDNAHIPAEKFSRMAIALCRYFAAENGGGAVFAWEHAGPGLLTTKAVVELGYGNVLDRGDQYDFERKRERKLGWTPSPAAKMVLLEEYRSALEGRMFLNPSVAALAECLRFFYTPSGTVEHGDEATGADDPTAARTNHGDRVIADALAWKMANEFVKLAAPPPEVQAEPGVGTMAGRRSWNRKAREAEERRVWM